MKFSSTTRTPADRLAELAMPAAMAAAMMAYDRASVRRVDGDGHLHIQASPISKANVCEYWGREIPDSERLGLDPGRLYRLYRDPAELAQAAPSFAGKPVLMRHRPQTATDHDHRVVVGSIGQDVRWVPPYIVAPLTIWDGAAIEGIESGEQRQISAGYRYRAEMIPGTADGVAYDGVMRSISANHCALVERGRAGPDVVVSDEALKPKGSTMPARPLGISARDDDDDPEVDAGVRSQLLSYLTDLLTPDQLQAVTRIMEGQSVPPATMAGDAKATARRVVAAHREKQDRAYLQRFPDAARVRR